MNILPKKSICLLLVCVMAVASGIPEGQAQDNYRLVEPTAEDYATEVDAIVARLGTPTGEGISVLDALADELQWRLIEPGQMPYQPLLQIYRAYAQVEGFMMGEDFIPPLIEHWLADHPLDFYSGSIVAFDDFEFVFRPIGEYTGIYSITALAKPFADDGLGSRASYVAVRDSSNTYHVLFWPVPPSEEVSEVGRFNEDNDTDFAYLHYDYQSNSYSAGSWVVVTWTGENFEVLSQISFHHGPHDYDPALTWQFVPLDEDPDEELVQTQRLGDNWHCEFIRVTYYDWQTDGTLAAETSQDTFPQSFGCLLRQAEEKMWAQHYTEAIEFYNQALAYPIQDETMLPYLTMRLGLAYLFTGQTEAAAPLFTGLSASDEENSHWIRAIREAYQRDSRLLPMCQAIYDQALNIRGYPITGTVDEYDGGFYGYDYPIFDLENLSCDLPSLIQSLISTPFTTHENPVDRLQTLGLRADSIAADLDADGDEDRIVWIASIGMNPLLFMADEAEYRVTVLDGLGMGGYLSPDPDMRLPNTLNQYRIVRLPDGALALAILDFGVDPYQQAICDGHCGGGGTILCANRDYAPESTSRMGDLTLWRVEDEQLTPFFFAYMCGWAYQPNWIPQGIENGSLVAGDVFTIGQDSFEVRPVTYTWDESTRTFVAPPQPVLPTPTPMPFSPQAQPTGTPPQLLSWMRTAFVEHDFLQVLELSESIFQQDPDDSSLVLPAHYYRALALEALARPDEALAEYIAIYERAPESAWGRLAGLHLESVE